MCNKKLDSKDRKLSRAIGTRRWKMVDGSFHQTRILASLSSYRILDCMLKLLPHHLILILAGPRTADLRRNSSLGSRQGTRNTNFVPQQLNWCNNPTPPLVAAQTGRALSPFVSQSCRMDAPMCDNWKSRALISARSSALLV